jgi:regulatory protein YycI of two-component signal transduction system YycFG
MKFIYIFLLLVLLSGCGVTYYFFDKYLKAEANKMNLSSRESALKNDKIIKEASEKLKQVEPWKPLGTGHKTNESKSAYLEGIGPITNIDCSQIYRNLPNNDRPIAYLNGVALSGILQPNSKIQQVIAQACQAQ